MNLADFDGKCVRITDVRGDHFDGICAFNGAEYCEHEFGVREAALEIMDTLFFAGDIESVEELTDEGGEYGCFRDPYGKLEELVVEDGADAICDALDFDGAHPLHAARLLRALADRPEAIDGELAALIRELAENAEDEAIRSEARKLMRKVNNEE